MSTDGNGHGQDNGHEWPKPTPLAERSRRNTQPLPMEVLPLVMREMVTAVAASSATPPEVALMYALVTTATALQRNYKVHVHGDHEEVLSIMACVALGPANRKSAVEKRTTAELIAWEQEQHADWREHDLRWKHDHHVAKLALKRAESPRASDEEASEALARIAYLEGRKPVCPRLIAGDVTQEKLVMLMADQWGAIGLIDAEGIGPLSNMLGRYTTGQLNVAIYLKGHAGDRHVEDRVGRGSTVIDVPRISMLLCMQPEVIQGLAAVPQLRNLGLMGRIFWCTPESLIGSRPIVTPPVPHEVSERWGAALRRLLNAPPDPHDPSVIDIDLDRDETEERPTTLYNIKCSHGAVEQLNRVWEQIERRIGPGGPYGDIVDWAGKAKGHIARIAALFHALDHEDFTTREISAVTMNHACKLGTWLLGEADHVLAREMVRDATDKALVDCERWLRKQIRKGRTQFSSGELRRARPTVWRDCEECEATLDVLIEHGWLRKLHQEEYAQSTGRPPSQRYEVNPRLFVLDDNGVKSQISLPIQL